MRFSINAIGYFIVAIFIIVGTVLLFFPIGHTGDGWGYAADVIQADSLESTELISAHHLLYNYWCYSLKPIFIYCKINPINGFTSINWFFYSFTLFIVFKILLTAKHKTMQSLYWTLLMAGCFGLLRFSLENETYVLPLFFALLGSHFILHFHNSTTREYLGFTFLAISVLFHQSYIFWFLAFAIHAVRRRTYLPFLFSTSLISVTYLLFAIHSNQSIVRFIFHDVDAGLVQVFPNINNVKFTLINGLRSVFQIHGNMLILMENWRFLSFIGISGILLFFYGLGISLKNQISQISTTIQTFRSLPTFASQTKNPFWVAFVLQFAFAFYSVGNAEFMVMLPLLFLLSFHDKMIPNVIHIRKMALGVWIYNTVFFIIPLFMGSFDDIGKTSRILKQEQPQKPFLLVSSNAIAIQNALEYEEALSRRNSAFRLNNTPTKIESGDLSNGRFIIGQNTVEILQIQNVLSDTSYQVYTDNTIIFNQIPNGSRASLLIDPELKNKMRRCAWVVVGRDSLSSPKREIQLHKLIH